MELNYFKEQEIKGTRYQYAHPSQEFWSAWRNNKSALGDVGISLIEELDDLGNSFPLVVRATVTGSGDIPKPKPLPPYILRDVKNLLPYQIEPVGNLVASLMSNNFAIDASDTGTGKTYTSLKTALVTGLQPAIICTKTGIYDWKVVCQRLGINPVFIYNWESCIGRFYKVKGVIRKIVQPPNPYVKMTYDPYTGAPIFNWQIPLESNVVLIFDEIHKANGETSSMNSLVRSAQLAGYKMLGLSATMCDRLSKFKMIGSLVGLFKFDEFDAWLKAQGCFKNEYNQWDATNEKEVLLKISKYIFRNYGVRVRKKDIPGFPECQNISKLYKIEKADLQNKKHEILLKKIDEIKAKKAKGFEFAILALRQKYRQLAESYKVPLLADLAREFIDSGHSVILFTCFVETLEALAKILKTTCVIKGGQKDVDRRKNINDFGADRKRLIIANIQAGGTAIDGLQDLHGNYSRVGILPPTDNPTLLKQALGRPHRSNSKSKSMNILVYAAGTVEVKIYKKTHNKLNNIDLINDGDLADDVTFKEVA